MQGLVKIIGFLLIAKMILFSACDAEKTSKNVAEDWVNDHEIIRLAEILHEYLPGSGTCTVNSSDLFSEKSHFVLVQMSVSCVTCLGELDSWHEKAERFHSQNVPVYFILRSNDDFNLFTFLFGVENNPLPTARFFFDFHNEMEALNPAIDFQEPVNLLFLDQSGLILAQGESILSPKFINEYDPNP